MEFIALGQDNLLLQPDGPARVFNVVLEQLCLLRAEVGAVQGTLTLAGSQLGIDGKKLVEQRIKLRDDLLQRIQADILAALSGEPPGQTPADG